MCGGMVSNGRFLFTMLRCIAGRRSEGGYCGGTRCALGCGSMRGAEGQASGGGNRLSGGCSGAHGHPLARLETPPAPTDISNLKNTLWRGMLGTNGIKQGGANLAV